MYREIGENPVAEGPFPESSIAIHFYFFDIEIGLSINITCVLEIMHNKLILYAVYVLYYKL